MPFPVPQPPVCVHPCVQAHAHTCASHIPLNVSSQLLTRCLHACFHASHHNCHGLNPLRPKRQQTLPAVSCHGNKVSSQQQKSNSDNNRQVKTEFATSSPRSFTYREQDGGLLAPVNGLSSSQNRSLSATRSIGSLIPLEHSIRVFENTFLGGSAQKLQWRISLSHHFLFQMSLQYHTLELSIDPVTPSSHFSY